MHAVRLAVRRSLLRPRASAPAVSHPFHSTPLSFAEEENKKGFFKGLTDRLQNKVEEKKDATAEEQFQKTLQFMIESKTLTMDDFYQHLKRGFDELESSWKGKIGEKIQPEEIAEARKQTGIFAAMTENERKKPQTIKRVAKVRIAQEAGVTVEGVNKSIRQFQEAAMFHAWVQRRHKARQSLPKTAAQSQKMFQLDKTGISSKKVNAMMKMNRRPHAR